jgi:hypothetical protein
MNQTAMLGSPVAALLASKPGTPLAAFFQNGLFGTGRPVQDWMAQRNAASQTAYGDTLKRTADTDKAGAAMVRGLAGNPAESPLLGIGPADIGALMGAVKSVGGRFKLPIKNSADEEVGAIIGSEGYDSVAVYNSGIDDAASRGQGLGIKAYQELADYALSNGKALRSDTVVSVDAARVYDALQRRGYKIEKNPNAKLIDEDGSKKWVAPLSSWGVFRVVGGPR